MLWQRIGNFTPLRGDSDSTTGRHVFALSPSGTVISLDPLTGKTQYSLAGAANVLAVDGSQAYGACGGGSNTQVCAYDTATGSLNWQAKPEIFSEPTLAAEAGGVPYLAEGFALDTAAGTALATLWDPFDLLATALAVGDGRVARCSTSGSRTSTGCPAPEHPCGVPAVRASGGHAAARHGGR